MFDCKCGKRHQKTSGIGRAHWKQYFENEELADSVSKKMETDRMEYLTTTPNVPSLSGQVHPLESGVGEQQSQTDGTGQSTGNGKVVVDKNMMTCEHLDSYLLKANKHEIRNIAWHITVTKNDGEWRALWRIESWEDIQTWALIPFTLDEVAKYAMLVDVAQKRKTGYWRRKRALRALKEAVKRR